MKPYKFYIAASLAIATIATADVTSINLTNADFEDPTINDGNESSGITGWGNTSNAFQLNTDLANDGQYSDSHGAESQVGVLWANGDSNQRMFQWLSGTSDTNGSGHTLTVGEAAGQSFELSSNIGIQSFNGWQNNHMIIQVGLYDATEDAWLDSTVLYTGTTVEYAAGTPNASAPAVNSFLNLDNTSATGDTIAWSDTFSIDSGLAAETGTLGYYFHAWRYSGNARAVFDDAGIAVVPEPGTYALLAGMLALGSVMIRRRR
ncbi:MULTISPECIES: PEP-CTERM sorting domain-containing protein [unclassified Lentimonas]|uniref:PEP-CTERM sorting domain-containing protein n=1 Tax=unclassified Lentimonas TaxID=2630993 RepID=UPI00132C2622|nr:MULTISPECIES: PEP-CTERM sorting domain-containing protein [unclassified Lentimonas]CAA6680186.1 Unannotated [Lentimonas sp. CC4]CAA6687060.1 Unannotated [Lentimonas sp. CC6]CAA7076166.1 Unannotated [Lentimonas sp. CC4]CAA7171185.1 Unannotated [Lentimonas sp. CC21]CAA7182766.1 Unannotated [Lentimonas sp. CC8]